MQDNLTRLQSSKGRELFPNVPLLHDQVYLLLTTKLHLSLKNADTFLMKANESGWLREQINCPDTKNQNRPADYYRLNRHCSLVISQLEEATSICIQVLAGQYRQPEDGEDRLDRPIEAPSYDRLTRSQLPKPCDYNDPSRSLIIDPRYVPKPKVDMPTPPHEIVMYDERFRTELPEPVHAARQNDPYHEPLEVATQAYPKLDMRLPSVPELLWGIGSDGRQVIARHIEPVGVVRPNFPRRGSEDRRDDGRSLHGQVDALPCLREGMRMSFFYYFYCKYGAGLVCLTQYGVLVFMHDVLVLINGCYRFEDGKFSPPPPLSS